MAALALAYCTELADAVVAMDVACGGVGECGGVFWGVLLRMSVACGGGQDCYKIGTVSY